MEHEKHILFISSWYPQRNNPTHGIFNLYFVRAVSRYARVSVIHVCSDEQLNTEHELILNREEGFLQVYVYYKKVVTAIPVLSHYLKRKKVLKAFDLAYEVLLKESGTPELIHLNVVLPMGIGAAYLSKKYNMPYVVNENWSGYCAEDGNYKGFLMKLLTKRLIAGASFIMPTSHYLEKAMQGHGLSGRYRVIPNVVDTDKFIPEKTASDKKKKSFIHISSLNDREKNVSGILRAFAMARKSNTSIELNIVGDGTDKAHYEHLVNELGLSSCVFFKGRLLSSALIHELNKSMALLMFSNYETFSLVNIEAFSCGIPVITSNAGAIPEYMKPEFGIMVSKGDEQELSRAILKMAEGYRHYKADYIREFAVQHFSYTKVGADLLSVYNSVLDEITDKK